MVPLAFRRLSFCVTCHFCRMESAASKPSGTPARTLVAVNEKASAITPIDAGSEPESTSGLFLATARFASRRCRSCSQDLDSRKASHNGRKNNTESMQWQATRRTRVHHRLAARHPTQSAGYPQPEPKFFARLASCKGTQDGCDARQERNRAHPRKIDSPRRCIANV